MPENQNSKKNSIESSTIKVEGNLHIGDIHHAAPEPLSSTKHPAEGNKKLLQFYKLIADNNTNKAIELLTSEISDASPPQKDQALMLRQRWNSIIDSEIMGTLSWEEINRIKLQITKAVLGLGRKVMTP